MRWPLRLTILSLALAAGFAAGRLSATSAAADPLAPRLEAIREDLVMVKVAKPGYREARIAAFNQRLDALVDEIESLPLEHHRRCAVLWPIKDHVVHFQVPIRQATWDVLDRLPARLAGEDARYEAGKPVASEVLGMQGYDRSRLLPGP